MADTPDAFDLGFELLPVDDEVIDADTDLDAAERSALEAALERLDAPDELPPVPFGRTWSFDFVRGRFNRRGSAPAEVRGLGAVEQWCLMAAHTARYAHGVFSDEFGMERPDSVIGQVDVRDEAEDYGERLREALLVHDRITDVDRYSATYDPEEGVLLIEGFRVVTDGGEALSFGPLALDTFPEAVDDAAF